MASFPLNPTLLEVNDIFNRLICCSVFFILLPVSLDCPLLIVPSVFSNVYLQNIVTTFCTWVLTSWIFIPEDIYIGCDCSLLNCLILLLIFFKISISSTYMYVRFIVHVVYGGVIIVRLMSMRIHQWFRTLFWNQIILEKYYAFPTFYRSDVFITVSFLKLYSHTFT